MADSKSAPSVRQPDNSDRQNGAAEITGEELSIEQERESLKKARDADAPVTSGDESAAGHGNLHYGEQEQSQFVNSEQDPNANGEDAGLGRSEESESQRESDQNATDESAKASGDSSTPDGRGVDDGDSGENNSNAAATQDLDSGETPTGSPASQATGEQPEPDASAKSTGPEADGQETTVERTPVNEAPTDIEVSNTAIAENQPGAVVATLATLDPDADDSANYAIADDPSGLFVIVGNELRLRDGVALDHETQDAYEISIQVEDSAGNVYTETVTIDVTDVNEGPSDLQLAGDTINENDAGAVVGTLSAVDPDAGDSLTYTISDDRFEIVGNELRVREGVSFDHESDDAVDVSVTVADAAGLESSETFTVNIADVNEGPSALQLAGDTISENDAGAVVGTLSAVDPDAGDSLTYTVSDDRFEIVGNELRLKEGVSFDHESDDAVDVSVTVADAAGLETSETFTINIADVNEAPVDFALTPTARSGSLVLNQDGGNDDAAIASNVEGFPTDAITVEVAFSSSQTDVGSGVPLFSYAASNGSNNEALIWLESASGNVNIFLAGQKVDTGIPNDSLLDGQEHQIAFTWDQSTNELTVYVDGEEAFATSINIRDLKADGTIALGQEQDSEAGGFDTDQIFEGEISEVRIFDYARSDEDIAANSGNSLDNPSGEAGLVSNWVMNSAEDGVIADVAGNNDLQLVNDADIQGGEPYAEPTVFENLPGATVGTLSAVDRQTGGDISDFSIADDPSGLFEIVGNEVKLKDGVSADYETQDSYELTIQATGAGGESTVQTVIVNVADSDEAPIDVSFAPAATNNVLSLNQDGGDDDFAVASNIETFPTDAITVEVTFASSQTDIGNGAPLFSYAASDGSDNEALIWLEGSSGNVHIFLAGAKINTGIPNDSLLDGEQHQISFSWDQSTNELTVYVDGEEAFATSVNIRDLKTDGTLVLGQEQDSEGGRFVSDQIFEGEISEVRIFDYVRSDEDITDNVGRPFDDPETEPGLVNNWVMNDQNDGLIEDLVGINHFELQGDAAIANSTFTDAPTVLENDAGAILGTISATDPQTGAPVTNFEIADDPSGLFEIVGNEVKLKDGVSADYEAQNSHDITIKAVGAGNESTLHTVTVNIGDVEELTQILGTGENDRLRGGDGNEEIIARGGDDSIGAGGGNDVIDGGGGRDNIRGNDGDDVIDGGAGNDTIRGDAGADELRGGAGNDTIYADGDDTVVEGGDGTDRVIVQGDSDFSIDMTAGGVERVDGGAGNDTLDATGSSERVTQYGNDGNDTLLGGDNRDNQHGGDGDDVIDGGAGNDTIRGDAGADVLRGGAGNDTIYADGDDTVVEGGDGTDRVIVQGDSDFSIDMTASGVERVDGGAGDDTLDATGSSERVTQYGNDGNDIIFGGLGNDNIRGGDDADTLSGGEGRDTIRGDAGNDIIIGGADRDTLDGGDGSDVFVYEMGDGSDRISGGAGGGWTDSIQLSDGDTPLGEFGVDWTIEITDGSIISSDEDGITLSDDADGLITLADGSTIQFTDIEEIII